MTLINVGKAHAHISNTQRMTKTLFFKLLMSWQAKSHKVRKKLLSSPPRASNFNPLVLDKQAKLTCSRDPRKMKMPRVKSQSASTGKLSEN